MVRGPDGGPRVALSNEPGIGTEPDPERLETCCRARARIEAA
ncbi:MAG TPA: hypothetical protein VMV69_00480 [Pirellulales bacterium]|nr:hypothetical protein [Pirellulales bacterium]